MDSWSPSQRKAVPASCLLQARMGAARIRTDRAWSLQRSPDPGRAEKRGAVVGTGMVEERTDEDSIVFQPEVPGREPRLCLHQGQLDIASHLQAVDGRQVRQAVVVVKQVLTVHSHLEAVTFTLDPHLDR